MGKWILLGLLAVLIIGCLIGCLIECFREVKKLTVTHYELETEKLSAGTRIRFAYLSDLHNAKFGPDNAELIEKVLSEKPDYVLFGGDMEVVKPHKKMDYSGFETLLRGLTGRVPLFFGSGNHEDRMSSWMTDETIPEKERLRYQKTYSGWNEEFQKLLEKYQVTDVSDSIIAFPGNPSVKVGGIRIPRKCYFQKITTKGIVLSDAYLKEKLSEKLPEKLSLETPDFTVILAHSPLFHADLTAWGADLVLSGHFHGGIIRLPLLGGVITPQYQLFHPYCKGMFVKGNTTEIVSAGLGSHTINVRFNNKPEIVIVDIKGK